MSNEEEMTVSRGADDESREALQAQSEARFGAALEQVDTELELELGQAPPSMGRWNIWGFGPWQFPAQQPSRIIMVNEWARLHTVVWMDPTIMGPNVAGFGGKIELEYFTSNMQTMTPAGAALNHHVCIDTRFPTITPSGYYYHDWWWFRPREAACLYEMNICARICNCRNQPVREYAAFARLVWDYDPALIRDLVREPPGWRFDHPIRFAVFDMSECDCP